MFTKIKSKIYFWLGLTEAPVIKVYNGFGNCQTVFIIGHVLALSPRPRKTYTKNLVRNFFAVIRLFMVKPMGGISVSVNWGGVSYHQKTESDGFFRFDITPGEFISPGSYAVEVFSQDAAFGEEIMGYGAVMVPAESKTGFISDVDDTFLISHSSKMRRRLWVLFTKNERNRRAFDGVINHYQSLATAGHVDGKGTNPFFYVSSSEWNLYDFLSEFARFNKLPKGIFLLGQIKRIRDFWKSGQNNHATKFMRIVRILEAYPALKFVLLGDDSQQDPYIYESVVKHFPDQVLAVYIRQAHKPNYEKVKSVLNQVENRGVAVCYFEHSSEAVIHSKQIGLIVS